MHCSQFGHLVRKRISRRFYTDLESIILAQYSWLTDWHFGKLVTRYWKIPRTGRRSVSRLTPVADTRWMWEAWTQSLWRPLCETYVQCSERLLANIPNYDDWLAFSKLVAIRKYASSVSSLQKYDYPVFILIPTWHKTRKMKLMSHGHAFCRVFC